MYENYLPLKSSADQNAVHMLHSVRTWFVCMARWHGSFVWLDEAHFTALPLLINRRYLALLLLLTNKRATSPLRRN